MAGKFLNSPHSFAVTLPGVCVLFLVSFLFSVRPSVRLSLQSLCKHSLLQHTPSRVLSSQSQCLHHPLQCAQLRGQQTLLFVNEDVLVPCGYLGLQRQGWIVTAKISYCFYIRPMVVHLLTLVCILQYSLNWFYFLWRRQWLFQTLVLIG